MKRQRYENAADKELSARVKSMGYEVSERQIERFRDAGLLPRPDGTGEERRYPPGTEEVVAQIIELREGALTFSEIMVILFFRGEKVALDDLRSAYAHVFRRMLDLVQRTTPSEDPFDIAESAGMRMARRAAKTDEGRRWIERLRGREETARSIFESTNIVMLRTVIEGAVPYQGISRLDALEELIDGSGLRAAETDRVGAIGPLTSSIPVAELGDVLDFFNIETLTQTLQDSTLDDLERARDALRNMSAFTSTMAEFIRRVGGSYDAMGFGAMSFDGDELSAAALVPWFRVLEARFPGLIDHGDTEHLARLTATNEARLAMLDAIPPRFWPLVAEGEDAVKALAPEEAADLKRALDRFAEEHPEEFALSMDDAPRASSPSTRADP